MNFEELPEFRKDNLRPVVGCNHLIFCIFTINHPERSGLSTPEICKIHHESKGCLHQHQQDH